MPSGLYIAGKWRPGAGQTQVTNKFTHQVIGSVATPSDSDLELALSSAAGAKTMAALPAYRRSDILHSRIAVDYSSQRDVGPDNCSRGRQANQVRACRS